MVAKKLVPQHKPTVERQWHLGEAAWAAAPIRAIQSLYNSMCSHITGIMVVVLGIDFSESIFPNLLKI